MCYFNQTLDHNFNCAAFFAFTQSQLNIRFQGFCQEFLFQGYWKRPFQSTTDNFATVEEADEVKVSFTDSFDLASPSL